MDKNDVHSRLNISRFDVIVDECHVKMNKKIHKTDLSMERWYKFLNYYINTTLLGPLGEHQAALLHQAYYTGYRHITYLHYDPFSIYEFVYFPSEALLLNIAV